ncbi:hypothetical protein [Nocardiopsis sp. LOL_012]|uniref:hypothetical protein n=1 Tax=Nocardiopsis sp. LOL_012 TaxID=3345409 RepID=UPI003A8B3420
MSPADVLEPTGPQKSLAGTGWLDQLLATPTGHVVERPIRVRDRDGYHRRPDPTQATTPAEFLFTMRRYLVWAGDWSYRDLEYLCGGAVKAATFQDVLEGDRLPRYVFLMAFVTACAGEDESERRRWVDAWRRIHRTHL